MTAPPQAPLTDVRAEQSVLGSIMLAYTHAEAQAGVDREDIKPDCFTDFHTQEIWRIINLCLVEGVTPNQTQVESRLHLTKGDQDSLKCYVGELPDKSPSFANLEVYAERVRELRSRREILKSAERMLAEARTGSVEQAQAEARAAGELSLVNSNLPIIEMPGSEVTFTSCAKKLFGLIGPTRTLFNRGGAVMRLATDDRGQPQLAEFTADQAKSCFEKHGRLMAWRKGQENKDVLKPVLLSHEHATGLLESQERRDLLPTIRGLIGCPMLREVNGDLNIAGPGYDTATGYYVTGGRTPPAVPLDEAVTSLWDMLADFNFATPADAARAMAMLLTPAMKIGGFFKGYVPAEVAEADASQSGKTFRLRVTAAVYNEWPAMVTQKKGGVGGTDESFSEVLVRGRPFVLLDNWRGQLSSAHIEAFLTARGPFACRIPHKGAIHVDPERFFVSMSSNGAESTLDFANRSCIVRIKKQRQDYPFKKFPEGDLLAHVEAQQPYFLGCIFSIIREWHRLGKPLSTECRHSFKEWVRPLDWICQHILGSDPIMNGHLEIQARVSNPDQGWLRAVMLEVSESNRLGQWVSASELLEMCEGAALPVPGLKPDADETRGRQRIGTLMAKLFKDENQIAVDGLTITRETRDEARTDGGGPVFRKGYIVTRQTSTLQTQ